MPTTKTFQKRLHPSAYGGSLRTKRNARGKRPISSRYSMHIVLRSTQARGYGSFAREHNRIVVNRILAKHAIKCEVELTGTGNAGNHLHLRVQVKTREQYYKFIRSITGEIALRTKRLLKAYGIVSTKNFWDRRPFTSIVATNKYINRLTDYLKINQMEGNGFSRATARLAVKKWRSGEWLEHEPSDHFAKL